MQCDMSLRSEFAGDVGVDCSAKCVVDDYTWGLTCPERQQAWVFVDRIVYHFNFFGQMIKTIVGVTVHELIHLCGYKDDDGVAKRGEELLAWNGCYIECRPLPPYRGK